MGIIEILLTIILTELFGIWFLYSFAIALVFSMVFLFFYHNNVTFNIKAYDFKRMLYFILFMLVITTINLAGVYLLAVRYNLNYILAIILVGVFTSTAGFAVNKNLLFKKIEILRQEVKRSVKRGVKSMKMHKIQ